MNPTPETPPPGVNPPGRPLAPVSATPEERQELSELSHGTNPRLARRASIILACLDGASNRSVALRFRVSKQAVGKWRARFQRLRVRGLLDQPRSGAPRRIKPQDVARVIGMTLQPPPAGLPRWTTRSMARACGLSQTTVNRIWRLHGLAPHRVGDAGGAAAPAYAGDGAAAAAPSPETTNERPSTEGNAELIVELRRDLAGLAQMLNAANPAALRVAVDAVEAAFAAAAGSADVQRRHGVGLAPEIRARNEARWRRARALFAEAKATLTDGEPDEAAPPEAVPEAAAPGPAPPPQPRR
jgi:transposase